MNLLIMFTVGILVAKNISNVYCDLKFIIIIADFMYCHVSDNYT